MCCNTDANYLHLIFAKTNSLKQVFIVAALGLHITGCIKIDLFEKNISLKNHQWESSFKPSVKFNIEDTASLYNLFVVLRHTDAYNYNNLWMNVYTRSPRDSVRKQQLDLRLADNQTGWLGSGIDDIFEHRIKITSEPVKLKKPGQYEFVFEQTMREDPLQHVMDIGLRIERVK